jgi:hypothetical protein
MAALNYLLIYLMQPYIRSFGRLYWRSMVPIWIVLVILVYSLVALSVRYPGLKLFYPHISSARLVYGRYVSSMRFQWQNTYFSDGAIAMDFVDLITDNPDLIGKEVVALDPKDSSRTRMLTYRRPYFDGKDWVFNEGVCTQVVPGSTSGKLAAWRRDFGFLLLPLVRWPLMMGPVYAIPAVLIGLLTMTLLGAAIACARFLWIAAYAITVPIGRSLEGPSAPGIAPLLVHISDLHITKGQPYEVATTPALWLHPTPLDTRQRASALFDMITTPSTLHLPILATGDTTDMGRPEEWESVIQVARERGITNRLILIPGNHDICINPGEAPDTARAHRAQRQLDFEHAWRELPSLPNETSKSFPRHGLLAAGDGPTVHLVLLDSTHYPSRFVLSNAVGFLGPNQLRILRALLQNLSGPLCVALHHHVCFSTRSSRFNPLEWMMVAIDAKALLQALTEYAARGNPVCVLHGHQHREIRLVVEPYPCVSIKVFGHASSTMGKEQRGTLDGRIRYSVLSYAGESFEYQSFEVNYGSDSCSTPHSISQ